MSQPIVTLSDSPLLMRVLRSFSKVCQQREPVDADAYTYGRHASGGWSFPPAGYIGRHRAPEVVA